MTKESIAHNTKLHHVIYYSMQEGEYGIALQNWVFDWLVSDGRPLSLNMQYVVGIQSNKPFCKGREYSIGVDSEGRMSREI